MPAARAAKLANSLAEAGEAFVAVLKGVTAKRWSAVPEPGIWSVGKEAEHVAEALAYHQWIVRLTIGDKVSSRRPVLERDEMTTALSPGEAIELIRSRTAEGVRLVAGLTDKQLALPTRPPRARDQALADTIEQVLIAHVRSHREEVAAKLASG